MVARRTAAVVIALAMIVGATYAGAAAASSPETKTTPALDSSSRAHTAVPGCKATDIVLGSSTSGFGFASQGYQ